MSHAQDLFAPHRRLSTAARSTARELWYVFQRTKAEMNALCALGVVAVAAGDTAAYTSGLRQVHQRLGPMTDRMARLREEAFEPDVAELHAALSTLVADLDRHAGVPPQDAATLWSHVLGTYVLGRHLAERRWAFEMRPEGLPVRREARAGFVLTT